MGEILKFQPRTLSTSAAERLTAPAEVFIFPGVRIERKGFSLADRLFTPSKRAHKPCQSRQKTKE